VVRLGAPQVLLASAVLVVFAIVGMTAVAAVQRIFTAGVVIGLAGLLAAVLCLGGSSAAGAAAVVVTVAIGLLPAYPLFASWLGKLPVPVLPDRPEQILADQPMPSRAGVFAAVARSSELLTGMLLAAAVLNAITAVLLVSHQGSSGKILTAVAALAMLLRGRLFPTPQQRIPMLSSGIIGFALIALHIAQHSTGAGARLLLVLLFAVVAVLVLAASLVYSKRSPSPYLGRLADISDVLAIMLLIPLACVVIGLYHSIQGLFASFG
jgi:type VII secretion integral membrane protein EccD